MCWYCYWGWPKPVADIYRKALADLEGDSGALLWGPAHLVWGDCNFDRDSVQWSLDHFEIHPGDFCERFTPAQMAIVRRSLKEMLALPDEQRDPEPADYTERSPEDYPPTTDLVLVRMD